MQEPYPIGTKVRLKTTAEMQREFCTSKIEISVHGIYHIPDMSNLANKMYHISGVRSRLNSKNERYHVYSFKERTDITRYTVIGEFLKEASHLNTLDTTEIKNAIFPESDFEFTKNKI